MLVIPAIRTLRQEDWQFQSQVSLGYKDPASYIKGFRKSFSAWDLYIRPWVCSAGVPISTLSSVLFFLQNSNSLFECYDCRNVCMILVYLPPHQEGEKNQPQETNMDFWIWIVFFSTLDTFKIKRKGGGVILTGCQQVAQERPSLMASLSRLSTSFKGYPGDGGNTVSGWAQGYSHS